MAADRTQALPAPAFARAAADPAVGDAWRALWSTRLVVWAAGVAAVALAGVRAENATVYDRTGITRPFGEVGDALVAPAARWDSVWFLEIAETGYDEQRSAFFPLYPLLAKALGAVLDSPLLGGLMVSVACLFAALVVLHRLVSLDHDREVAGLTVLLVAAFPGSLWMSAVYSEALFLLLSVVAVYGARTDRWLLAAIAAMFAASTRSIGVLLLVPLGVLWWQAGRPRDGVLLAGVPLGLGAFCLVLAAAGHDALGPFRAQEAWERSFAGPFGAVPDAAVAAYEGARAIATGEARPTVPFDPAILNPVLLGVLVLTALALAGAMRRLPAAYWLYVVAALSLPLSWPVDGHPLMSLPRFVAVLWPLHLWLALWLVRRAPAARAVVLGSFLAGLACVSALVSTWNWVA
jgi:hypothetical protein